MYSKFCLFCAALLAVAVVSDIPQAHALDPAPKCEAGKLKEAGKYALCRLKAEAKGVKRGLPADYSRCVTKFELKWPIIESNGAGQCPSQGDEASMNARITAYDAEIAIQLSGVRYEDTGLGTVIDHLTGLEWQKTDDAGGPLTDKDNPWLWTNLPGDGDNTNPDGDAFLVLLHGLNNCVSADAGVTLSGGYAGYCDWRMPQIDELVTIYDCSFGDPCIDQQTFGPVNVGTNYMSLTVRDGVPEQHWVTDLDPTKPIVRPGDNQNDHYMRAVRGGS